MNPSQAQGVEVEDQKHWYLEKYEQDADGDTELHTAMINLEQKYGFAIRLINATWPPALLNTANKNGLTAMHFAAVKNNYPIIRHLLVAGADPLVVDRDGHTPLHLACLSGAVMSVAALLTPFSFAEIRVANSRNVKIPDVTKSVKVKNNQGEVPLRLATKRGSMAVVKLLLRTG